jgi:hypothetical protein
MIDRFSRFDQHVVSVVVPLTRILSFDIDPASATKTSSCQVHPMQPFVKKVRIISFNLCTCFISLVATVATHRTPPRT